MPFYLFQGSYTTAAIKAMVENPQDREGPARAVIEAAGGKLHHFFFAFGKDDIVCLLEAPDDTAVAAVALAVGAGGALSSGRTTRLMSAREAKDAMTAAKAASASYEPPAG